MSEKDKIISIIDKHNLWNELYIISDDEKLQSMQKSSPTKDHKEKVAEYIMSWEVAPGIKFGSKDLADVLKTQDIYKNGGNIGIEIKDKLSGRTYKLKSVTSSRLDIPKSAEMYTDVYIEGGDMYTVYRTPNGVLYGKKEKPLDQLLKKEPDEFKNGGTVKGFEYSIGGL